MAQACLGVLLQLGSHIDESGIVHFPLAQYAGDHFGDHAEFEGVLSHILDGVDQLLDADKPYFAALLRIYPPLYYDPKRPDMTPTYYVAERGFWSLVNYLISKRPEDVNLRSEYGTPLHGALVGGHSDVAQLLLGHCVVWMSGTL
jgi:hypothetical protein